MKRAQSISVFIMLALFIIIASTLLYYSVSQKTGQTIKEQVSSQIELASETNSLKLFVEDCLKETVLEAEKLYGVDPTSSTLIEDHIKGYLQKCVDSASFSPGIDIEKGPVDATVKITDELILADVSYPLTLGKGQDTSELKSFFYSLPLTSMAKLSLDSEGKTKEEVRILTSDGKSELIIPIGTKVTDKDGKPVEEIFFKTADRNKDGLVNSVVVGMTIYEGLPDGILFSPAITVRMRYSEDELAGLPEEELKIGWYDKDAGIWWGLPSSYVDTENNIVSAELEHFTDVGKMGCTEGTINKPNTFTYENVLKSSAPLEGVDCDETGDTGCSEDKKIAYSCENQADGSLKWKSYPCENTANKDLCDRVCSPTSPTAQPAAGQSNPDDKCKCECEKACKIHQGKTETWAVIPFVLSPKGLGDGCVMKKPGTNEADIILSILCSEGDTCYSKPEEIFYNLNEKPKDTDMPEDIAKLIENAKKTDPKDKQNQLKHGKNKMYVKMKASDNCAILKAEVTINGRNIRPPPHCENTESSAGTGTGTNTGDGTSAGECTLEQAKVQDIINTLCGKGQPDYNDNYPNCEQTKSGSPIGFNDPTRGQLLRDTVSAAQGVDSVNWRAVASSLLPSDFLNTLKTKLTELGINLACSGGSSGTGGTITECTDSTGGSSAIDDPIKANGQDPKCTQWEKEQTTADIQNILRSEVRTQGKAMGLSDSEITELEKYALAIATVESGNSHCKSDGTVLLGDSGNSVGLMQINKIHAGDANGNWKCVYRLKCNIKEGVRILLAGYKYRNCANGNTICSDNQYKKTYQGGECAARAYNGWTCCIESNPSNPADCGNYVQKVKSSLGSSSTQKAMTKSECTEKPEGTEAKCKADGDTVMDAVSDCSAAGGWPTYYISDTNPKKVCCKTLGCCIDPNTNTLEAKKKSDCPSGVTAQAGGSTTSTGKIFKEISCEEVKGCCTWDTGKKCWHDITQADCKKQTGSTFYPLEEQCSKHSTCKKEESASNSKIVEYALEFKKNNCLYASNDILGYHATPDNCNEHGLTCAGFVRTVFFHVCNQDWAGNGNMKCDYPDKVNTISWSELKPGDICEADYKDTTAGHVVIYIGTGKVSKPVSPYSFEEFTTPGTEKVFIQSIGPSKELSEPGVSFINEQNFKQYYHNIKCCRVKECKSTNIA